MEKPLLILDLDETLIHATKEALTYEENFKIDDYFVYYRPHLHAFLHQVAHYFKLAIWSSASDDYVRDVVSQSVPQAIELQFVWGRSKCTPRMNPHYDENGYFNENPNSHYHYVKLLKKVKKQGYSLARMLIVDDTPHKVINNYGNAIYPIAFEGEQEDDELFKLMKYLIQIKDCDDFRSLEKRFWRQEVSKRE